MGTTTWTHIIIKGIVQGVGFRPFIYRLAINNNICGHVFNTVSGVHIKAGGNTEDIHKFIEAITQKKPAAASIDDLQQSPFSPQQPPPTDFTIKTSQQTGTRTVLITPDMDTCDHCLAELFDPADRRYQYPFINCTNCGPRYTLIEGMPYDRPQTSMKTFSLCRLCMEEYTDPANRRFHAQPNACQECGPTLSLVTAKGIPVDASPILKAQTLLAQGNIFAIKGIGGFHLAADAENNEAVSALRARKGRSDKPLAIMIKSLDIIADFATVNAQEEKLLSSSAKPIVLLDKKLPFPFAPSVSPNNNSIGVMLPYSPLHHLLLHNAPYKALVMTSGNLSEEPIVTDNDQALKKLSNIADFFLLHDRIIVTSNDDSVLRIDNSRITHTRRSRSIAPRPINLNIDSGNTLAVGGALKNTVCFAKQNQYFLSQHIGDLEHLESINHFKKVISHMQELLQAKPDLIVHDLHPDYPSTTFANKSHLPTIGVQHHHAHAVSCMAENNLTGPVIGVVLDGTGFGEDQTIWGGEVLIAELNTYERAANFTPIPLPGGDMAVKEPWRMAVSYLYNSFGEDIFTLPLALIQNRQEEVQTIVQMIKHNFNAPLSSSCGRLFDSVSALLGLAEKVTFEGQAAIALEMIASKKTLSHYPFQLQNNASDCWQISFKPAIKNIVQDILANKRPELISSIFHKTIITALTQACLKIRETFKLNQVVLSGGVFQNRILLSGFIDSLNEASFDVFTHRQVPANDGGLSLGQAVAGRAMFSRTHKL